MYRRRVQQEEQDFLLVVGGLDRGVWKEKMRRECREAGHHGIPHKHGLQRLMFEHHRVVFDKPLAPILRDLPINIAYHKGSYMAQHYAAVQGHIDETGQRKGPDLDTCKGVQGLLVRMVPLLGPHHGGPFQHGDRVDWTDEHWRALLMIDPASCEDLSRRTQTVCFML